MADETPLNRFRLDGRVAVVTGGAGLLGRQHALAVAEAGGVPVLWDLDEGRVKMVAAEVAAGSDSPCHPMVVDITDLGQVENAANHVRESLGEVRILINNAANDPKVKAEPGVQWSRLEHFPLDVWEKDLAVGLKGALVCTRVLGARMAAGAGGVILNIASDLGLVAPDQRLYRQLGVPDDEQPVKPVTYSVVKHGLVGLTRYVATYWAEQGVRCNALAPGGVLAGQPDAFREQVESRIPMGRMAGRDEYRGAVQFLVSDASSYVNGAVLVADGGRTVW